MDLRNTAQRLFIHLFLSTICPIVFAQSHQSKGTVIDNTGEPIIGANILIVGTTMELLQTQYRMMNRLLTLLLIIMFFSCMRLQAKDMKEFYRDLPFKMPIVERRVIPNLNVCLTDFGGSGDGVTLNSDTFEKAIQYLASKGGGRLVVPQGVWLTGPIELENNVELHLSDNSIVVFSQDKSLYPIVETVFEGCKTFRCKPQLSAVRKSNIAVTGKGIIDGAGDIWRLGRKNEMPPTIWNECLQNGGILSEDGELWYPTESYYRGAKDAIQNIVPWAKTMEDFESIRDFLRPVMVNFRECDGVVLEGVVFQNSPCWNVHLSLSRDIIVHNIAVRSPWYAKNGDGIDIESCTNLLLTDSWFDVGDDAICIKSGKDQEGYRRGVPASNIIVDNCVCYHGHGGFVVGSEMSGGVKNISISNCRFSGTDVGLRFKSKRGRGGIVEKIYIKNIMMNDIVSEALLFDLFYGKPISVKPPEQDEDMIAINADETTPQFKDIYISNVTCHGAKRAMLFNGLPEMNVQNVLIEDCHIYADEGAKIHEASNVNLCNVMVTSKSGPALMLNNVKNLTVIGFQCPWIDGNALVVTGSRNRLISVSSSCISKKNTFVSNKAEGSVVYK